jgi:hypothetical protein
VATREDQKKGVPGGNNTSLPPGSKRGGEAEGEGSAALKTGQYSVAHGAWMGKSTVLIQREGRVLKECGQFEG